jgi:hypothetical protein
MSIASRIDQYRRITAKKNLQEKVLIDVLSAISPRAFGRSKCLPPLCTAFGRREWFIETSIFP